MVRKTFGRTADGATIEEVTLSAGDLTVSVINWGAVIRDVRLKGVDHPLVLGFDRFEDYLKHSPHFGALAGRSANRIGGGRFTIDGTTYQLTKNENGRTHLHGAGSGFGKRPWVITSSGPASVTLALQSVAGEDGYPGNVNAAVSYSIEEPSTIRMDAEATTDAPTIVNLAQHSYFNLDDSPDILDHEVRIFADSYTPVDGDKVPTGEIAPVAGTDYDFTKARPIRRMKDGARFVYDINYAAAADKAAAPRPLARLASAKSGVVLDVTSTEPGVQFYDGCMMHVAVPGLGGRPYGVAAGCCFEAQLFPDAPNHPNFLSSVLRPGETYRQTTLFAFTRQ
jgi:aldose 1-epimerase